MRWSRHGGVCESGETVEDYRGGRQVLKETMRPRWVASKDERRVRLRMGSRMARFGWGKRLWWGHRDKRLEGCCLYIAVLDPQYCDPIARL